jgi:transposase
MAMTEVFMSNSKQYTDEFRAEAVKQVIERGFTVVDVASRIGIPKHTLYGWVQAAKKTMPAAGPQGWLAGQAARATSQDETVDPGRFWPHGP